MKQEKIRNAVDSINLKIDQLNQNLVSYEEKIDQVRNLIPRDLPSVSNSLLNRSSGQAVHNLEEAIPTLSEKSKAQVEYIHYKSLKS
jgi:t-SNARE complex subunit (syntaxin)